MRWLRAALLPAILAAPAARAAEGGGSLYLQGTFNDFVAGLFPEPGVYARNDVFYYDASIGARPLGGRVGLGVTQQTWVDTLKLAYVGQDGVLGARYGAAMAIPVVLNSNAVGSLGFANQTLSRDGSVAGLGDIYLAPLQLNWSFGNSHLTVTPAVYAPTGGYDRNRQLNTGRNYWGFDLGMAYTWLQPKYGQEVSLTAGYLVNTRNNATGYRTGDEFHLDWLAGQHFSPRIAVAAIGYWYEQVTGDSAPSASRLGANGFRGHGVGVGAAVVGTPSIAGRDVSLIGKWLTDVSTRNRFDGNIFMLSAAFKF